MSREERADDEPGAFGEVEEEIPQESLGRALASKFGMEEYCAAHDPMPQRPLSPLAGMEKSFDFNWNPLENHRFRAPGRVGSDRGWKKL